MSGPSVKEVEGGDVEEAQGSRIARNIRRFAVPIVLIWVAIAALTNVFAPQLEVVGEARSVGLNVIPT